MSYRWYGLGDVNAFFGLMLDNVVNLVLLAGILIHAFGFPEDVVYGRMFPGTALGVMFGDLVYTWLAFRLAKKTGRQDVTAMPLGLDSPSTIGMAFAVLGPAFVAAKSSGLSPDDAAIQAWQVGMATMVVMGVLKLGLAFAGPLVQRLVPAAGLLGSLAGIGIALLGTLQFGDLMHDPIVGFAALGVLWYSLVSKIKLPFRAPEVLVSAGLGTALFYALWSVGLAHTEVNLAQVGLRFALPMPSLGFLEGLPVAVGTYLPVAVPFGLLTVIGGINVTESARLGGDDYDTREILLTEALATLIAGLCGGVAQSTPYIGQPAYKAMGGKAAYTLATGLFVGLGGMLGYIPLLAVVLPKAALVPILMFVAADITEQSFHAVPKRHAMAVTFAMFPNIAQFGLILLTQANFRLTSAATTRVIEGVSSDFVALSGVIVMLAHGFILTGMLWGGGLAYLADRKAMPAVWSFVVCAALTAFGVIHSVDPSGGVYWPWAVPDTRVYEWVVGYLIVAALIFGLSFTKEFHEPVPEHA